MIEFNEFLSIIQGGKKKKEGGYTDGMKGGMLDLFYKHSCKEGKWTEWHANGRKALEENYINGERDGKCIRTDWYKNGKKMKEENYNNGQKCNEKINICGLFGI